MRIYDWEGSDEHKTVTVDAIKAHGDVHSAVAEHFGISRQDAKATNWRLSYGGEAVKPQQLAECEGAQQNETDGAAEMAECLLSDLHHSLHHGERCSECGYTPDTE